MEHLVNKIQLNSQSFYQDYMLVRDACHTFKGNLEIVKKPKNFEVAVNTPTLWKILDASLLQSMEC